MKSTYRVLFYLKKNAIQKNGNTIIMIRITINGEMHRLGVITFRSAHSGDWVFGQRSRANGLILCGYFT